MELAVLIELITTVGFPIVCVLALGWFVWRIYKQSVTREEELRQEIRESQAINAEAIRTLALYAERLDTIQTDIVEIKEEITKLNRE